MRVGTLIKAGKVCFYVSIIFALQLGCAICDQGGPGTEKRMVSWQEFEKGAKTTHTSISCNNSSEGVNNIKCLNSVIAILKVHSKVESQEKHVDEVIQTLMDYCNGGEACSEDATNGIKNQCKNEDIPSKHAEFLIEFICIKGTDTDDMWEDNVRMKHDQDLLYVISPPKERSNSNCNFSLTSLGKRQWSIFLFHVGYYTDFVVYNGEQLVLTIKDPVYGKPPFPALLIDQPMCGQNISIYFSGQIDVLMAIKRGPVGTPTQRSPLSTRCSSPSVTPSGPPPRRPGTNGKSKRMRNVYIGVGAGVGGLLLLLILLAVVIFLLRKRRRREPSPQATGELYSQPMKKQKQTASNSRGTDGNHTNNGPVHHGNKSKNSINSDAPPPVPLFLGMEKNNGKDDEMYVNLTPTAPIDNLKLESGKRKRIKPRGKRKNYE